MPESNEVFARFLKFLSLKIDYPLKPFLEQIVFFMMIHDGCGIACYESVEK